MAATVAVPLVFAQPGCTYGVAPPVFVGCGHFGLPAGYHTASFAPFGCAAPLGTIGIFERPLAAPREFHLGATFRNVQAHADSRLVPAVCTMRVAPPTHEMLLPSDLQRPAAPFG
eukprot:CAMPEP_0117563800 /NCGR_PEP_ID=MMETSP0784-20121206/55692_1 /TAXON_ID=39447 /ORGANISM="" /LENGTH=114 /DNA_ID=CAMNT_0005361479 /DNA_START=1 /DNA_END=342 /DNA_ORIENTATION=+